jgi:bacterioferritin (cytochrome b1)
MNKLVKHNKQKVIDFLCERLAFERSGVQLYDSILAKMDKQKDGQIQRMVPEMREHRNQEQAHYDWLEKQIRQLGGDPTKDTEYSKLVKTESEGIEKVILNGDNQIPHLFHALLTAEVTDNVGWELLVDLADEAEDDEARKVFRGFLHEEEDHLKFVMRAVEAFQRHEVLGEPIRTPKKD